MILDKKKLDKLTRYGLNIDGNMRNIPDDFVCEIPCSLKRTEVGPFVKVGAYSYMVSGYLFATTLGRYCSIGEDVQIGRQNHPIDWVSTSPFFYLPSSEIMPVSNQIKAYMRDNHYQHGKVATKMRHTTIGHDVWVGHGAIINAGVKVGNGAIIAAGSVVTKDVAPYTIVGGNPAKFIRYRIDKELIEPLQQTQWWNYSPKQLEMIPMHNIEDFIAQFSQMEITPQKNNNIHLTLFKF